MDQFSDPNEHKIVRKERRKTLEKKFLDRNRSGSEKGGKRKITTSYQRRKYMGNDRKIKFAK
jgi:hypothetical protein